MWQGEAIRVRILQQTVYAQKHREKTRLSVAQQNNRMLRYKTNNFLKYTKFVFFMCCLSAQRRYMLILLCWTITSV